MQEGVTLINHWRSAAKAEGRCIDCGDFKVNPEVRCPGCAEVHNVAMEALREERLSKGLCRDCDEKAIIDETLCPRHRELANVYAARYKAKKMATQGIAR